MTDHAFDRFIPMTTISSGAVQEVLPDLLLYTDQVVNLFFIRKDGGGWILVDAGMPRTGDKILEEAERLFGSAPPEAILLTHGHFDHIGGMDKLMEKWDVPIYAHTLELPFLTGKKDYPEPDPTVEGGMVAKMSGMFPNEGVDLSPRISSLPEDGSVPGLHDWKWLHTPGHSPGHISLFRERDRTLIAGDAFVTVRQDKLFKVLTQEKEISGPPRYLTTDWKAAEQSVSKLAGLKPETAVTGHGLPVSGPELQNGLQQLAENFQSLAVPDHGKYVDGD
ncbi:MBL fold metallo-hydrolase [Peribacillus kribbensis]|uniref:MBL fold metallo-hydrolase n=1 Tax=Peribacillus kribbensis TaxID=356658 RepID=UPI00042114E1|nr:MBL fold metallo-hydrolase [Peribacillus kribbensis]